MAKYDKCSKCGAIAVQLCTTTVYEFYGDQDDREGDPSEYADQEIVPDGHVTLFAHICFECGELEDVGIETPREKALNTLTKLFNRWAP
jgi:ribosomal protein L32